MCYMLTQLRWDLSIATNVLKTFTRKSYLIKHSLSQAQRYEHKEPFQVINQAIFSLSLSYLLSIDFGLFVSWTWAFPDIFAEQEFPKRITKRFQRSIFKCYICFNQWWALGGLKFVKVQQDPFHALQSITEYESWDPRAVEIQTN